MSNPGSIPSRWLECPRKSSQLIANKFLVFKTPLDKRYDDQVADTQKFPPSMLFSWCRVVKFKLGLWIDLTNTNRFYDKSLIEKEGVKYLKIQCRGRGETPSLDQTERFVMACHNYITQNPLEVIGVHCTHGFNRSGFMIISYLVKKLDCDLDAAIQEFATHRTPGIYKQDYLDELYKRYGDTDDILPAPALPDWCEEEEDSEDEANAFDRFTSSSSSSHSQSLSRENFKRRPKLSNKKPVFMAGVPGVTPFQEYPKYGYLQRDVQKMCNWKSAKGFPGCQPVSMDLNNIALLQRKPYRVSWKADGTRYMMLIKEKDHIYFFDRDNNVFQVENLTFPVRNNFHEHIKDTLLDGEMVIDKVDGESIPRYLVYDIIYLNGKDVSREAFHPARMAYISEEIVNPRNMAIREGHIKKAAEPFSIRCKHFWDITQAGNLLGDKFAKNLSHEPDGLIFQPSKEPYKAGTCDEVLKWKPLDMNSVDFRLKIIMDQRQGIVPTKVGYLYVGKPDKFVGNIKYTKALKDLDNKIIECKFENNQWVFMRERTDKSFPNSWSTAEAVMQSIKYPVTKEYLLQYIDKHKFIDDTEVMAPPQKRARRMVYTNLSLTESVLSKVR